MPFIAVAEYRFGLHGSTKIRDAQNLFESLLQILPILLPTPETLEHYASLAYQLKKKGRPIPTNDIWIAALAHQHEMPVLSRDHHFDFIDGIERIDW